jgi:hypothetical protein
MRKDAAHIDGEKSSSGMMQLWPLQWHKLDHIFRVFNELRLGWFAGLSLPGGDEELGRKHTCKQGFGSGSGLDPDSIRPMDPDPYSESGAGSRRAKMTHKSRKKLRNFMF